MSSSSSHESASKILARLLTLPANRSCADCRVTLVDASVVYASVSKLSPYNTTADEQHETTSKKNNPEEHEQEQDHVDEQEQKSIMKNTHDEKKDTNSQDEDDEHENKVVEPSSSATTAVTTAEASLDNLLDNHARFAPPGYTPSSTTETTATSPDDNDNNVHPSTTNTPSSSKSTIITEDPLRQLWNRGLGHGVLVCALCGAAHQLCPSTNRVFSVQDIMTMMPQNTTTNVDPHNTNPNDNDDQQQSSSSMRRQWILQLQARGNEHAKNVLERHLSSTMIRPKRHTSMAERLVFVRAKYEAHAFVWPRTTHPRATAAWQRIVQPTMEWAQKQQQKVQLETRALSQWLELQIHSDNSTTGTTNSSSQLHSPSSSSSSSHMPHRLVDYFCVITAETQHLDPKWTRDTKIAMEQQQQKSQTNNTSSHTDFINAIRPSSLTWSPRLAHCYPATLPDMEFPQHVGSFVFPEGITTGSGLQHPQFLSFCLTTADGARLYGGALQVWHDTVDVEHMRTLWQQAFGGNTSENNEKEKDASSSSSDNVAIMPDWMQPPPNNQKSSNNNNKTPTRQQQQQQQDIYYLPKCIVVLSHYPFFDLWRKFLLQIYRIALVEAPLPLERFIANFCSEIPLPPAGHVEVRVGFTKHEIWTIKRPPENELPMAEFSFRPLFTCLSVSNILVTMGCLLEETRVALVSKHYALLTPVAEALVSLLFPFHWQGMYIPIMPYSMLDILDAPVPYLVGLHSRYLKEVPAERRPAGVVFVDLDEDVVHLGWQDDVVGFGTAGLQGRTTPALPEKDAMKLKNRLAASASAVYVPPDSGKAACILTGNDESLPFSERDAYAQLVTAEYPNQTTATGKHRRSDVFKHVDRAYNEHELYIPLDDFLTGQGLFHEKQKDAESTGRKSNSKNTLSTISGTPRGGGGDRRGGFMRRLMPMTSPRPSSRSRAPRDNDDDSTVASASLSTTPVDSILDMKEPAGFSVQDIRTAFLKFFVGVFKEYRSFVNPDDETFRTEEFVASKGVSERSMEYLRNVMATQMFERFIQERIEDPNDPEVLFFDVSIDAKLNRFDKSSPFKRIRNGIKDTSFLDDKSKQATEKFTPPPPSNWGLPDDGTTFHYGAFPELDSAMFGKVRPPAKWPEFQKSNYRSTRRTASEIIRKQQSYENGLLEALDDDSAASRGRPRVQTQGPSMLENALFILSKPYVLDKSTKKLDANDNRYRSKSPIRERLKSLSGSEHGPESAEESTHNSINFDEEEAEEAQMVIMSCRRKASILAGILIDFQAVSKGFVWRNRHGQVEIDGDKYGKTAGDRGIHALCMLCPPEQEKSMVSFQSIVRRVLAVAFAKRKKKATGVIQTWVRLYQQQKRYQTLKHGMITLQALYRSRTVSLAYHLLQASISRTQSRYRAFRVRLSMERILKGRMELYRRQIFTLWKREHTSLVFRTKFWMYLKRDSFLMHNLAEDELRRLWTSLQLIQDPDLDLIEEEVDEMDVCSLISSKIGISNKVYKTCVDFEETIEVDMDDDFSNVSSMASVSMSSKSYSIASPFSDDTSRRGGLSGVPFLLTSERTQIYERLSRSSSLGNDDLMKLYDTFKIGMKDKKRKKALAEALWRQLDQADSSAALMFQLFPELKVSDTLQFVEPSRKGMRRFHFDFKPAENEAKLQAQKLVSDRVRADMGAAASAALCRMPEILAKLPPMPSDVVRPKRQGACVESRGFESWSLCRYHLQQALIFNRPMNQVLANKAN